MAIIQENKIIENSDEGVLRRRIVFIVSDGLEILDLAGPVSIFARANVEYPDAYEVVILAEQDEQVHSTSSLSIFPNTSWDLIASEPIDTLVVVGGRQEVIVTESFSPELIKRITFAAKKSRRVASTYNGVFALGEANLLKGRRVTTHWSLCDSLQSRFRDVEVVKNQIFVLDGNIWTSAGALAGIDLALALVEEDLGRACAVDIARTHIMPGMRPGKTPQISTLLDSQSQPGCPIRDLLPWIQQNLADDLRGAVLAARLSMSVRNFNRIFAQELGVTPHNYVNSARLQYAAILLLETDWNIEKVTAKSGFKSPDAFQKGFKKLWDMTPTEYRISEGGHKSYEP